MIFEWFPLRSNIFRSKDCKPALQNTNPESVSKDIDWEIVEDDQEMIGITRKSGNDWQDNQEISYTLFDGFGASHL